MYNASLLEELCQVSYMRSIKGSNQRRPQSTLKQRKIEREEHRREQFALSQASLRLRQEELLKRRVREEKEKQNADFAELLAKLNSGKKMVDSIDQYIALNDDNEHQKLEKMHATWNEDVFKKVQKAVDKGLAVKKQSDVDNLKRKCFQEFLDASNSKGALFLDTILNDYDPFKMRRELPKMPRVGALNDPSRRVLDKHLEETALMSNAPAGALDHKPKTREVLATHDWADGKIQATPHGHFSHMMNKEHEAVNTKMTSSKVPFEHYDIYKGKSQEYPKGKRVFVDKGNKSSIRLTDASTSAP